MSAATRQLPNPKMSLDEHDAKRLIQATMLVATLPQIMSDQALELAATHLHGVLERSPGASPILSTILMHLESRRA